LQTRFYLQAEVEAELTDRLEHIKSPDLLGALVIIAAQVESLTAFTERLDQEVPSPSGD
jgi:hypothetical protein